MDAGPSRTRSRRAPKAAIKRVKAGEIREDKTALKHLVERHLTRRHLVKRCLP